MTKMIKNGFNREKLIENNIFVNTKITKLQFPGCNLNKFY